jgi:hypothetical protein
MINKLKKYWQKIITPQTSDMAGLSTEDIDLIARIRAEKLTYLSEKKLANIVRLCRSLEEKQLPGVFLEAGCALGGSAILIASVKQAERSLFIYDVFGMIPPPTSEDSQDVHDRYKIIVEGKSEGIGGDKYYGYETNLYQIVLNNLKKFGIDCAEKSTQLVQGLVQDTLNLETPVAFAHVDVDWYEPVMTCLERVFPKLVVGGSIVLDDYNAWGGCRKATDEYLRTVTGQFALDESSSALTVTRIN